MWSERRKRDAMADSNIVGIKAHLQRHLDDQASVFDEMDRAYRGLGILARAIGEMRILGVRSAANLRVARSKLDRAAPAIFPSAVAAMQRRFG